MYNLLYKIHNTSNIEYYSIYDVFLRNLRSQCVCVYESVLVRENIFMYVKMCLCVWKKSFCVLKYSEKVYVSKYIN